MKKINLVFLSLLCFLSLFVHSQNAPVTTAGIVTNAVPGNDVVVPVTVNGFNDIGTIALTLDYNPAVLTYVSETHDPLFPDMSFTINAITGRITVSWFGTTGVTVADGTPIFSLTFTYISGSSNLSWFDNGGSCEYAGEDAISLNDSPTSTYYIDGHVSNRAAPVTIAPTLSNQVPGTVNVPVTVTGFTSIGTLALTLEYYPQSLTYLSYIPNAAFDPADFSVTASSAGGGKYKLTISWFGTGSAAVTLPDFSTLVTLSFNYTNENGIAYSTLLWKDTGGSCEYSDANAVTLWDSPQADFYHDGLVQGQSSPVTYLPVITNAASGELWVPVTVTNFNNVQAIALTIEYDPDVMTYVTYNTSIPGLSVGSQPLPNGNRKVTIGRYLGSLVTLTDGATLVNLKFNFISGSTPLTFLDDGESCAYSDIMYNALYDYPQADFYHDGLVTGQLAPITYLPEIAGVTAGNVPVVLTVDNFDNITTVSLSFDYDPLVITYNNSFTSPLTGIGVDDLPIAGGLRRISLSWFASGDPMVPKSITDGGTLIQLMFTYISGSTSLNFFDNGGSCEYSDANVFPLYDIPTENFYKNGFIADQLAPLIKADTVTGGTIGSKVTVPVRVWNFDNINSFSLTLDYNPTVLTFDCATSTSEIATSFTAFDVSGGRVEIGWFGTDLNLPDGSVLFYMTFIYHGSTTALTWFDNGPTCSFTGQSLLPLYDEPTGDFYKNGRVVPSPAPAVWTGATSAVWDLPANWQANIVPDSFFDIFIEESPTPLNWPIFPGNFTVGENCRSLTLNGAARMQVGGNMVIMPGRVLAMNGAGLLKVGGDWKNFGVFVPSTGTVEFTGTIESNIDEETYPSTALSAYQWSSFAGAMTELSGGTAGPTGDDTHADVPIGFTFNYLGVDYTQLRINTNGWVSMDLSGPDMGSDVNNNLFFTAAPGTALAPWWDNLEADGSTVISYQSAGGVLTVEWKNILAYNNSATARLNFQLKLYSGTNVIEFWYGTATAGTHSEYESASIGIKDATGGPGRFIEGTSGSTSTAKSCLESTTGWPAVNYRFSPPASLGTETFWKVVVSKDDGVKVNVKRDVNVSGN